MPKAAVLGNCQGNSESPSTLRRRAGRDGSLPARVRRIFGDEIEDLRAGLLSDMGGPEAITTGEAMLINAVLEIHAIRRLLGHRILAQGATDRRGEVKGAVLSFFAAVNSERLNLMALGLKRRAKQVRSLDSFFRAGSAPAPPDVPGGDASSGDVSSPSPVSEVPTARQGVAAGGESGDGGEP